MKPTTSDADANAGKGIVKENDKFKLYGGLVLLLAAAAIVSILLTSHNTGAGSCNSQIYASSRQTCILGLAARTGNSSLCSQLPSGEADNCYVSIAESKSDPSACQHISSGNLSNMCYTYIANRTNNPQLCSQIKGNQSSSCIYSIAVATNSTRTCGMINGNKANVCNDTIYFNSLLKSGNPRYCGYITDDNSTSDAEEVLQNSNISSHQTLNLELSQLFEYTAYYNNTVGTRDMCYLSLAYLSSNNVYCGSLRNATLSSECVASLNTTSSTSNSTMLNYTQLYSLCDNQTAGAAECTYTVSYLKAADTGNVTICKGMPAPYSYQCYFSIAEKYNSTKYCSYIDNSTINNECVFSINNPYINVS